MTCEDNGVVFNIDLLCVGANLRSQLQDAVRSALDVQLLEARRQIEEELAEQFKGHGVT